MNRTAMFIAISGTLRPVPAAAVGLTNVGSKGTTQTLVFNPGELTGNATFALPPGCAAGDTASITCICTSYGGMTFQTPAGATELLSQRTFAASYSIAVYARKLVQADVDAGNVTVPVTLTTSGSWSIPASGIVDVDRGVSDVYADVIGAYATGTWSSSIATWTIPGATTTKNGDLLRYSAFHSTASSDVVTPSGDYTSGDVPIIVNNGTPVTGFMKQATAGATGDVSLGVVGGAPGGSWAGVLIALKAAVPGITLDISLPSGIAGSAYEGYIHGTNVDGATGTITYSADALPDGVSLDPATGAVTASSLTTDTATTPVTTTYTVSNGNTAQDQTYQQVWDIAAALTLPNVVQSAPSVNTSRQAQITLPAAPTVGNWLVMLAAYNASSGRVMTPPDSSWVSKLLASGTTPTAQIFVHQVVEGDGTYYAFVCGAPNQDQVGVMYEVANTSGVGAVGNSSDVAGMTVQTATASSAITNGLALAAYASSGSGMGSLSASSGWTPGPTSTGIYGYSAIAAFTSDDTDPAASITVTHVFKTGVVSLVVMKP